MSIEVANESDAEVDLSEIRRLAEFSLDALHVSADAELGITFIQPDTMAVLHEKWLDLPGPTDVMSFPMDELRPGTEDRPTPAGMLGDIVVCPQVAAEQAASAGHSTMAEIRLLTVHGLLHLLGFDHAEPEEKAQMFSLQDRLLEGFRHLGRRG
ncbi:MAG: rRNA maturation RNase YbeY [Microbacteriaceae bacterium]|jgi:probable rRNA maturation factor|nr:rRNA maturation RNase YbeY [Microbacteriaceae bacterium]MCI1206801.1 rRNA maturation RNase YbeY [Microbacteriaceae bacterium]